MGEFKQTKICEDGGFLKINMLVEIVTKATAVLDNWPVETVECHLKEVFQLFCN